MPEQRDETDAFTRFVKEVEPGIRIALSAAYGREHGREATAEALAYAWENWQRVGAMSNPAGYLYRVGQTKARRLRRRRVKLPLEVHGEPPWIEPALESALGALSKRQRSAVVLVHGFQWTHAEVGELLSISTPTVKTHVQRGLEKLRAHLDPGGAS